MVETEHLSAAKRALLEKYLQGSVPHTATAAGVINRRTQAKPASPVLPDSPVPLVPVQTGGSKRPLFYVHVHWIGGAFYCFAIARTLGADQPFYVIDPYRFDGLPVPPTMEEMAAAYIKAMRAVQPEGPYLLAGFCGGALIAYEIAQQLRAEGQAVDLLAVLEPIVGPIRVIRLTGHLVRRVGRLVRLGPDKQCEWFLRLRHVSRVLRRVHDENSDHVDGLLRRWRDEHPRRFALIPAAEALRQDWLALFLWPVSAYVPRPYPGKMTYLIAGDPNRPLWWDNVVDPEQVEIHMIPGTHDTCRTEHVRDMAECLKACLRKAQAEEGDTVATSP